jgi:hypothetical protein
VFSTFLNPDSIFAAMNTTFDPYQAWLSIPAAEQPPNYYRLLGLTPFEDQWKVISAASDRQMEILQRHQSGETAALATQLLTEVAVAKICLLSRARKQSYDGQLRQQLQGVGGSGLACVACPPATGSRKAARRIVTVAIGIALAIVIYCCATRFCKYSEQQPPSNALRSGLTAVEGATPAPGPVVAHRGLDGAAVPAPLPQRNQR